MTTGRVTTGRVTTGRVTTGRGQPREQGGFETRPYGRAAAWTSRAALLPLLLALSGCARGCTSSRPPIHLNPNMDQQPRYEAQASSDFFYDGAAMRPPVEGTVARGELRDGGPYWTGKDAAGVFVANPMPMDAAATARGARRYAIYCGACHDQHGDGKGILFERGKVPTPSFHSDRLRAMPDGQIFDTITNGVGLMPSYRYPIPVADRWAIVAHLRTLQERRAARDGVAMPPIVQPAQPAQAAAAAAAPAPAQGTP